VATEEASDQGGKKPETRDEVFDLVKKVLVSQLGIEDESRIKEKAHLQEDLDADSLDLVELIMELEDQTEIKIPDQDAQQITTVGEAVNYICKALGIKQ
jgi:acyl carrier protein